jgi:hypothetical protein
MKSVKEVCFFHFMPQASFHLFLNGFFHCSLHLWMMLEALQMHKKQLCSQENEYVNHDLLSFDLKTCVYPIVVTFNYKDLIDLSNLNNKHLQHLKHV